MRCFPAVSSTTTTAATTARRRRRCLGRAATVLAHESLIGLVDFGKVIRRPFLFFRRAVNVRLHVGMVLQGKPLVGTFNVLLVQRR